MLNLDMKIKGFINLHFLQKLNWKTTVWDQPRFSSLVLWFGGRKGRKGGGCLDDNAGDGGTTISIHCHCCTFLVSLQLTILWPQQAVQLSCWSLMLNGIRPQPTHKRFNSACLQNKFLICRKIPSNILGLDATISC